MTKLKNHSSAKKGLKRPAQVSKCARLEGIIFCQNTQLRKKDMLEEHLI